MTIWSWQLYTINIQDSLNLQLYTLCKKFSPIITSISQVVNLPWKVLSIQVLQYLSSEIPGFSNSLHISGWTRLEFCGICLRNCHLFCCILFFKRYISHSFFVSYALLTGECYLKNTLDLNYWQQQYPTQQI
jgi:hypothetical protein